MRKKTPYNIYDSDIIGDAFEYNRLLIFEPEKEDAAVIFYGETIRFLRHLSQATKSRILVTSDAPDEICLLDGRDIAWSANTALIEEIMNFFYPARPRGMWYNHADVRRNR